MYKSISLLLLVAASWWVASGAFSFREHAIEGGLNSWLQLATSVIVFLAGTAMWSEDRNERSATGLLALAVASRMSTTCQAETCDALILLASWILSTLPQTFIPLRPILLGLGLPVTACVVFIGNPAVTYSAVAVFLFLSFRFVPLALSALSVVAVILRDATYIGYAAHGVMWWLFWIPACSSDYPPRSAQ